MLEASCSAITLSRSSARCAPQVGQPLEKAMSGSECVCAMWSTNGRELPKKDLRLVAMPPTLMPDEEKNTEQQVRT